MAKIELNRSKPFQTVHGDDTGGAHYSQDGFHFDHNGVLIEELTSESQQGALKRLRRQSAAEAAAKAAYEAAMAAAEASDDDDGDAGDAAPAGGDVDLAAYLRGQLTPKPSWPKVVAACKALTGTEVNSKAELIEVLVDEHELVPAEEVKLK